MQKSSSFLTRRKAIGLLGATAGVAITATLSSEGIAAEKAAAKKPTKPSSKPANKATSKPVIRTLLKDIAPEDLGAGSILFHEHLSIRYPVTRAMAEKQGVAASPSYSDDVDLMIEETRAAGKAGVTCIVDGGHPDMDRDLDALKRIATESGVHIVGSGGFYMER